MKPLAGRKCLCGAHLGAADTGDSLALVCPDCGAADAWPEHITDLAGVSRDEVA